MDITIKYTITDEMMLTLFSDMNSGANYWAEIIKDYPRKWVNSNENLAGKYYEYVLWEWVKQGGTFTVSDVEDEGTIFVIGLSEIIRGLQVMAEFMTNDFNNLLTENDDATTGDVFLQCCCFPDYVRKEKDVVYG